MTLLNAKVSKNRLFPRNAITMMLKLFIVWREPNHDIKKFGRSVILFALYWIRL